MFNFFRKNRNKKVENSARNKSKKLSATVINYHPKIILAWAKAIEGNDELLNYLLQNGHKELAISVHAIKLKDEARDWLMQNGFPHIMALINASEGNLDALSWLRLNNFELFYHMALAIEGEIEGFTWINKNSTQEYFLLTRTIKKVKDEIEEDHNDTHRMSTD